MVRGFFLVFCLAVLLVVTGCGGPATGQVSGKVTWEGKALPEGEISFSAPGEGKPPEILTITNGEFSGKVTTGKKTIQINAYKEGKAPAAAPGGYAPEGGGSNKINYIPEKYNANTTLSEEVTAAGPNNFKFDLTSK